MEPTTDPRCPGCFADRGFDPRRVNPCPNCGYDERAERSPLLLAPGTVLKGQFQIGRVLGRPGAFGITYLAWDLGLHRRVAIKEYLPRELAGRGTDRATVVAHCGDDEAFRFGLHQFLVEARTLARLDHPNVVRVFQVFEANGTAYLAMEYYEGLTLADHMEARGGRLPESQALMLIAPVLDGLRAVHAQGFLHRDIKPQNIYLARTEGGGVRPILLDFGAARQSVGERSRSLSVVLTEGYAPFEQYIRKGHQGPWTDIYAVGTVLYRMLCGELPPDALQRMELDTLKPASAFGVSRHLSQVIARALALSPEDRPQRVDDFQNELQGHTPKPTPVASPLPIADLPPPPSDPGAEVPRLLGGPGITRGPCVIPHASPRFTASYG
jgi:serine/threonine protein kinase